MKSPLVPLIYLNILWYILFNERTDMVFLIGYFEVFKYICKIVSSEGSRYGLGGAFSSNGPSLGSISKWKVSKGSKY